MLAAGPGLPSARCPGPQLAHNSRSPQFHRDKPRMPSHRFSWWAKRSHRRRRGDYPGGSSFIPVVVQVTSDSGESTSIEEFAKAHQGIHPRQCPAILVAPIVTGTKRQLNWLPPSAMAAVLVFEKEGGAGGRRCCTSGRLDAGSSIHEGAREPRPGVASASSQMVGFLIALRIAQHVIVSAKRGSAALRSTACFQGEAIESCIEFGCEAN